MNRIIVLITIVFLFNFNILADMAPPPIGEYYQVALQQNYPDYQFYIVSYDLKVVPNPNPPHPSRPNMTIRIPETFNLRKIDLSIEKPFTEAIPGTRIENRGTFVGKDLIIVAVNKSLIGDDVEAKIKDSIENQKQIDGVFTKILTLQEGWGRTENKAAKVVINTVTGFDEKQKAINIQGSASKEASGSFASNYPGLGIIVGLLLTLIALLGFWLINKRRTVA
ncbi:MAG TPA: hypothetical protein PKY82_28905 [Pyrinomonadaceae bacterium]|nr:hypothetical protein [Pyrinomonadaceae bacterium]